MPASLQAAVAAQRAAGIVTVVAAGNSGSGCSTVVDPPATYADSFTVGALNTGSDTIASFSSRGPSQSTAAIARSRILLRRAPAQGRAPERPVSSYGTPAERRWLRLMLRALWH